MEGRAKPSGDSERPGQTGGDAWLMDGGDGTDAQS